ncbi:TRAP transporter small permease [Alkalihalobacillus deserti]|uniref:TRAP transporter small permease n=1 Tax=Alkalihalobacillus deserti TaxID=2879466 RepID=UPI001D1337F5|nr:TRAP transporter small permease [Alkalihalobacillus deserti]
MEKVTKILLNIEEGLAKVLLVSVVLLVFLAATGRWLGFPVAWSVNIAQLLLVWIIFLGANIALRNNQHIGVDVFTSRLPLSLQKCIELLILLLMAGFLSLAIYYGTMLSLENSSRIISNTTLSYSYITMGVPIGCLLMLITIIAKIIRSIKGLKQLGKKTNLTSRYEGDQNAIG